MYTPQFTADSALYENALSIATAIDLDLPISGTLMPSTTGFESYGVLKDYINCYKQCRANGGGRFRCAFSCLL